jgi:hypothetical protein
VWSPVVSMLNLPLMSKLLQSSRPPSNSLAENVSASCGCADRRVDSDTAYSRRDGVQASSAGLAGSVNKPSYQASHAVAICCTAATSPAAMFSNGSNTICGVVGWRNADASGRASGARPTMV